MSSCCLTGFEWSGTPVGKETKLANNDTYVTGTDKDVAVLLIHDIYGWTFNNTRLLADHFAKEIGATVYAPDFFGGDVIPPDTLSDPEKRAKFDVPAFVMGKNGKAHRWSEIEACAKSLKAELGFKKVGAVGYCYGGWAVFQLGKKSNPLVDAISTAHPSLLTKEEINDVGVPAQILAPEHDPVFVPEMKAYANETIPKLNVAYDYQYFPGVAHGFAIKCNDEGSDLDKKSLERAKNAVVGWFAHHLHIE
ncbi:MAG: hypothetical protein HETSPECPRED_006733 [Heterodermia speciosa]|uniref:Dienelactone hydrolase domain-containing protein n=1 Tax=Heterodermia speciosa TaxID=116794 RepID=A0A8H3IP11_9LECA|nr:MAG: hypothetical protein HETSPECPRED_006733 [Heterodermia speciosa]